jgi:hypothetical protein
MESRVSILVPSRRRFLFAAASLLAAPAIVRAASLMPVKAMPQAANRFEAARTEWELWSGNTVRWGSDFNGRITSIAFYARRISAAQLRELTA